MNLQEALADENCTILDVRTSGELQNDGQLEDFVHIPLQEVPQRIDEIAELSRPLVICCRSGNRSGQAIDFLKGHGQDGMINGMGWTDVKFALMGVNK